MVAACCLSLLWIRQMAAILFAFQWVFRCAFSFSSFMLIALIKAHVRHPEAYF